MNLKEEMAGKIIKGNLNGEQISEQWINVNNAIMIAEKYGDDIRSQLEPLVRQLVAFNHFLCEFHEDAKRTRNEIALCKDLKKAQELAMFEWPVVQGSIFNLDIYKIGEMELDRKDGDIQKAIKYMLQLSNQSA